MSNQLSNELLGELFAQESSDPFLMLLTLDHASFSSTIRLVNNPVAVTSRGEVYQPFPFKFTLPPDDGETAKTLTLTISNVSLDFIGEFRTVTTPIDTQIEMILASNPDVVQADYLEMKLNNVRYNRQNITATVAMDSFLNASAMDETYTPSNFQGLF